MSEVLFTGLFLGDERDGGVTADLVRPLLVSGEEILIATKGLRDGAVFTNKRIVIVNRQGITGKKIEFASLPLRSITAFSIENSGTFDLDAELKVYGSGWGRAEMQFTKGFDIKKLADYLGQVL
ncbi:PH domain-containing protein [Croceicoccus sp. Ery15]|uniref:PH domain-containing protein n=1 Tax=Croceicoccus sp. Ery15 TaxID=1703338 RepID=UPI001E43967D|nr:PH domain-containing protein [Croceicoccus sp. Ery15]